MRPRQARAMGYFRRHRRRARCAKQAAGSGRLRGEGGNPRRVEARPVPPPGGAPFIRVAVGGTDPDSGQFQGVFRAAGRLEQSGRLLDADLARLRRTLRWFGRHLPSPRLDASAAVFWFRSDAFECVRKVWDLVRLLDAHDARPLVITVDDPGQVVYRDHLQVAAIPQRELYDSEYDDAAGVNLLPILQSYRPPDATG